MRGCPFGERNRATGLVDDRTQQRDVVLFYMVDIRLVGYAQPQCRAVEIDGHDGLEPLNKLFLRGLLSDFEQTVLPHVGICRIVGNHDAVSFPPQN